MRSRLTVAAGFAVILLAVLGAHVVFGRGPGEVPAASGAAEAVTSDAVIVAGGSASAVAAAAGAAGADESGAADAGSGVTVPLPPPGGTLPPDVTLPLPPLSSLPAPAASGTGAPAFTCPEGMEQPDGSCFLPLPPPPPGG